MAWGSSGLPAVGDSVCSVSPAFGVIVVADVDDDAAASGVDGVKLVVLGGVVAGTRGMSDSQRQVRPSSVDSQTPTFAPGCQSCLPA